MQRFWIYPIFLLLAFPLAGILTLLLIWLAARTQRVEPADAIVVFGAAVWGREPSTTLRLRATRGAELYKEGLAPVVVCSGGTSGGISESRVMAGLIAELGVPASAIVLDEMGVTTRATFDSIDRIGSGKWHKILAVSSPFHMLRVMEESRRHGIEALPCPARRPTVSGVRRKLRLFRWDLRQYVREMVAVWSYRFSAWRAHRRKADF